MATAKTAALNNALAAKATAKNEVEKKPLTPSQQVGAYLDKMMPAIQAVLPSHVTAERMSRIALNVIRTNPTEFTFSLRLTLKAYFFCFLLRFQGIIN